MKTFIFPATCDFGVGAYHEPVMVEVKLSDKDAKKLLKYAEDGEESFAECEVDYPDLVDYDEE